MLASIDLTVFMPKYRQALLFAMIEGLMEGQEFSFIDNRTDGEIETELQSAGLRGYHWIRSASHPQGLATYTVKRDVAADDFAKKNCCGCCCREGGNKSSVDK